MTTFYLMLAMALLCVLTGCAPPSAKTTHEFMAMGTLASVISTDDNDMRAISSERETHIAKQTFSQLETIFTVYSTNSELSRLNQSSGQGWLPVSQDTEILLSLARRYGELSDGAFDVTVGPIVKAWGFNGGTTLPASLPSEKIEQLLTFVGWQSIEVRPGEARLIRKGTTVDLGGIAKGYAVDRAWKIIRENGGRNFIVNLGGNMRASGKSSPDRDWTIGVRNPFSKGDTLGRLILKDGMAVATSGNYERFVTINNKKYAHIFDPRTGMPVEGMASVTVLSHTAVDADALSTSCFVLGTQKALELLAKVPGNEVIFVPDGQPMVVWVTSGLKDIFEIDPRWTSCVKTIPR